MSRRQTGKAGWWLGIEFACRESPECDLGWGFKRMKGSGLLQLYGSMGGSNQGPLSKPNIPFNVNLLFLCILVSLFYWLVLF